MKYKDNTIEFGGNSAFIFPNDECEILNKVHFFNESGEVISFYIGCMSRVNEKDIKRLYLPKSVIKRVEMPKDILDGSKKSTNESFEKILAIKGEKIFNQQRFDLWIHTNLVNDFHYEHKVENYEDIDKNLFNNENELPLQIVTHTKHEYDFISFSLVGRYMNETCEKLIDETIHLNIKTNIRFFH